jgi:hypothetical protein
MKVDMSASAVTLRLRRASQLRRLCLALGKATPIPPPAVPATPPPPKAAR